MSVLSLRREIAFELFEKRGTPDPLKNWLDAGVEVTRRKAIEVSQKGGKPDDLLGNWLAAERLVRWQEWVEASGLRPYLAIKASESPTATAQRLWQHSHTPHSIYCAFLLDGAPEYGQWKVALHLGNCVDPKALIERKSRLFFAHARSAIKAHRGDVLPLVKETRDGGERHLFQDACVAVFSGDDAYTDSVASSLRLHQLLGEFNDKQVESWPEELHARSVLAGTWEDVLRAIPRVKRNETLLAAEAFRHLTRQMQTVLLAGGVRLFDAKLEERISK